MKRILSIIIAIILILALSGCSAGNAGSSKQTGQAQQTSSRTTRQSEPEPQEVSDDDEQTDRISPFKRMGQAQTTPSPLEPGSVSRDEIDDYKTYLSEVHGLFYDVFLVYARHEQPFIWEYFRDGLNANGFFVFQPSEGDVSEGGFAVYDMENEEIWLAGSVDNIGTEEAPVHKLTSIAYYLNMDCVGGGIVVFNDKCDIYYVSVAWNDNVEVGSLEHIIEILESLM